MIIELSPLPESEARDLALHLTDRGVKLMGEHNPSSLTHPLLLGICEMLIELSDTKSESQSTEPIKWNETCKEEFHKWWEPLPKVPTAIEGWKAGWEAAIKLMLAK